MDIDQFTTEHSSTETAEMFELENSYTLDIDITGTVMAKAGSMVAYKGNPFIHWSVLS